MSRVVLSVVMAIGFSVSCVWAQVYIEPAKIAEIEDLGARCEALNRLSLENVGDAPGNIISSSMQIGKKATKSHKIYSKKHGHVQGMPTSVSETLPDHCEVKGYVTDHIHFSMVLPPPEKWNNRFMLAACMGWCGSLIEPMVIPSLARGYATLTNNGGHFSGKDFDGIWAHQNIPARINFAYRANHVTAQVGKAIAAAYYGSAPKYNYITGFSKGGNAGLMAAQRYPEDFDGVFSKAPVVNYNAKNAAHFTWQALAVHPDGKTPVMYADKLPILEKAVLDACDGIDGLVDNIIDDPRKCNFDPSVLLCREGQSESECLTPPQVEAVRKLHAKPYDSEGNVYFDSRVDPGSEGDWADPIFPTRGGSEPPYTLVGAMTGLRYMVFKDNPGPGYDWTKFDYVKEKETENLKAMSEILDPDSLDLKAFKDRGGKLIIVHGWADAMVSAEMSIDWFEKMQEYMGGKEKTAEFAQLYVVPAMFHGSGGRGPYVYKSQSLLEKWVEEGIAPDHLILEDEPDDEILNPTRINPLLGPTPPFRTRPVYPYPSIAKYKGEGDPNVASSFERVD